MNKSGTALNILIGVLGVVLVVMVAALGYVIGTRSNDKPETATQPKTTRCQRAVREQRMFTDADYDDCMSTQGGGTATCEDGHRVLGVTVDGTDYAVQTGTGPVVMPPNFTFTDLGNACLTEDATAAALAKFRSSLALTAPDVTGSDQDLNALAVKACLSLETQDVTATVTALGLEPQDGVLVVAAAVYNLCPQHITKVG